MATKAIPENIKAILWPHMGSWKNDPSQSLTTNYDNLTKKLTLEENETLASYVGMKKNDFLKRLTNAWEKDKKKDFDMFGEKSAPSNSDAMDVESVAGAFGEPSTTEDDNPEYLRALQEARETLRAIEEAKSKY